MPSNNPTPSPIPQPAVRPSTGFAKLKENLGLSQNFWILVVGACLMVALGVLQIWAGIADVEFDAKGLATGVSILFGAAMLAGNKTFT